MILIFILNLLVFVYVGCFFQGFVILLLYVGAITVLFLFLMMLFDFRAQFFINIPIIQFLVCFVFLIFLILFLSNLEVSSFYLDSFHSYENYFSLEENLLDFDRFDNISFSYMFDFVFDIKFEVLLNEYCNDYFLFLNFFDFDRNFSQLFILNAFVYKNCFYLSIILLVGFFSLLVLLIIFFILKRDY